MARLISPAVIKAREERARRIYDLWAIEGKTFEEIGVLFGVTKQRIGQIIKGHLGTPAPIKTAGRIKSK